MKKIMALVVAWILMITLVACANGAAATTPTNGQLDAAATAVVTSTPTVAYTPAAVEYDEADFVTTTTASTTIRLEGATITVEGGGATVEGNRLTIIEAGTYTISGVLDDGQIVVDAKDKAKVVLALNGASITCTTGAPIYIANAEKTVITLVAGTENFVADGATYVLAADADEPNAAIFSHDDLTINGDGALTVNAAYNHGIFSKDDLKITGGTLTVNAVGDGVKGRNSIAVKAGVIIINAGGDGLQATNDVEAEEGYIAIEGGALTITAGLDGMQAVTGITISGGDIALVTGGGAQGRAQLTDAASAKGLKAGADVSITGGRLTVDSADDALHSNGSLTLSGGELTLASGDDGIHADATLTINAGTLNITKSYEGIESAVVAINGGEIRLTASDDGLNTAGGNDGAALSGRPAQDMFATASDYRLYINGGYVYIDAGGDGIDANGPIDMSGGVVLVNGPTENMNGALDYSGWFNITGGTLVAVGSAGMAMAPSASSTQYSVLIVYPSAQAAGASIHIESASGEEILTFVPTKMYQSLALCSPALQNGATYTVYSGGSSSGAATDGLYTGGDYVGGAQVLDFTIASIVTSAGATGGMGGPGMLTPGGMPGEMPGESLRRPGGPQRP